MQRAERILVAPFRTILLFVICLGFAATNVSSQSVTFFTAVQGAGAISKSPDKATYNAGEHGPWSATSSATIPG